MPNVVAYQPMLASSENSSSLQHELRIYGLGVGVEVYLTRGSYLDTAHSSCDSSNTSWRLALCARDVCLIGEYLVCSIPSL